MSLKFAWLTTADGNTVFVNGVHVSHIIQRSMGGCDIYINGQPCFFIETAKSAAHKLEGGNLAVLTDNGIDGKYLHKVKKDKDDN